MSVFSWVLVIPCGAVAVLVISYFVGDIGLAINRAATMSAPAKASPTLSMLMVIVSQPLMLAGEPYALSQALLGWAEERWPRLATVTRLA